MKLAKGRKMDKIIEKMKKFIFVLFFINSLVFSQDNIHAFYFIRRSLDLDKSFSDEFDKSKLDETKWWDFNPAWHGRKPSHFARSNVKVKKGVLRYLQKI